MGSLRIDVSFDYLRTRRPLYFEWTWPPARFNILRLSTMPKSSTILPQILSTAKTSPTQYETRHTCINNTKSTHWSVDALCLPRKTHTFLFYNFFVCFVLAILTAQCKTAVTPLLTHCQCSIALNHRYQESILGSPTTLPHGDSSRSDTLPFWKI